MFDVQITYEHKYTDPDICTKYIDMPKYDGKKPISQQKRGKPNGLDNGTADQRANYLQNHSSFLRRYGREGQPQNADSWHV